MKIFFQIFTPAKHTKHIGWKCFYFRSEEDDEKCENPWGNPCEAATFKLTNGRHYINSKSCSLVRTICVSDYFFHPFSPRLVMREKRCRTYPIPISTPLLNLCSKPNKHKVFSFTCSVKNVKITTQNEKQKDARFTTIYLKYFRGDFICSEWSEKWAENPSFTSTHIPFLPTTFLSLSLGSQKWHKKVFRREDILFKYAFKIANFNICAPLSGSNKVKYSEDIWLQLMFPRWKFTRLNLEWKYVKENMLLALKKHCRDRWQT